MAGADGPAPAQRKREPPHDGTNGGAEDAEARRKRRRRWDDGGGGGGGGEAGAGGGGAGPAAAAPAAAVGTKRDRSALGPGGGGAVGVSMDALAKARAALEKQRELKAKLKLVSEKNAGAAASLELAKSWAKRQREQEERAGAQPRADAPSPSGRAPPAPPAPAAAALAADGADEEDEDEEDNPFFDPEVAGGRARAAGGRRAPRAFSFYEPGELAAEAERERELRDAAREGPDAFTAMLGGGPLGGVYGSLAPPAVEWWDEALVRGGYAAAGALRPERITVYVEHPVPVEPPAEPPAPPPQPLILTKGERKKLRTQRRMAMEKERQEMIRQGLMEAPKPRVKLSNMMRVLGESAAADPTAVEAAVRAEAMQRVQAHEDRNLANKLTPAERRAKRDARLHSGTAGVVSVSLYRLVHMRSGKQKFRVEVNADENRLTGRMVRTPGFVAVLVEGGGKGIRRFDKLMMDRIKWGGGGGGRAEGGVPPNACARVWSGTVCAQAFRDFKFERCSTDFWADKVFRDAGVPQYFDMARQAPQPS